MAQDSELEFKAKGIFKTDKKPKLSLQTLSDKAILFADREDYDLTMKIYECGGWRWGDDELPTNFFPEDFNFTSYCVDIGISEGENSGIFEYDNSKKYLDQGYMHISIKRFCEIQGISHEKLREINNWFDKHKPHRASKGEN